MGVARVGIIGARNIVPATSSGVGGGDDGALLVRRFSSSPRALLFLRAFGAHARARAHTHDEYALISALSE